MDTQNDVLKALYDLGFRYKKNKFDGYDFTFETFSYECKFDPRDQAYVSINVPNIYILEDEQYRPIILDIINEIHNSMKISKVILVKNSVWVTYEMRIINGMDIEDCLHYAIKNLMAVTERFLAKVNGGGLPSIGD